MVGDHQQLLALGEQPLGAVAREVGVNFVERCLDGVLVVAQRLRLFRQAAEVLAQLTALILDLLQAAGDVGTDQLGAFEEQQVPEIATADEARWPRASAPVRR